MSTVTARTILDAPTLPLFDEEELRWQQIRAEHDELMATPEVAAVVAAVPALTDVQQRRLSGAWLANFQVYRLDQLNIGHRISRLDPRRAMRLRAVGDSVWSIANAAHGPVWSGAHAVADAALTAARGDLLTPDEARLFNKPWVDVMGA